MLSPGCGGAAERVCTLVGRNDDITSETAVVLGKEPPRVRVIFNEGAVRVELKGSSRSIGVEAMAT